MAGVVVGIGRSHSLASISSLLVYTLLGCDVCLPFTSLLEGEEIDGEVLRLRSAVVVVLVGSGDICSTSRTLDSKAAMSESVELKSFNLDLPLSGGSLIGGPGFL